MHFQDFGSRLEARCALHLLPLLLLQRRRQQVLMAMVEQAVVAVVPRCLEVVVEQVAVVAVVPRCWVVVEVAAVVVAPMCWRRLVPVSLVRGKVPRSRCLAARPR